MIKWIKKILKEFRDDWRYFTAPPYKSAPPYECHVVSRDTYNSYHVGDTFEGRKVVEGFLSDNVDYILVTKENTVVEG